MPPATPQRFCLASVATHSNPQAHQGSTCEILNPIRPPSFQGDNACKPSYFPCHRRAQITDCLRIATRHTFNKCVLRPMGRSSNGISHVNLFLLLHMSLQIPSLPPGVS